jgi:hypothetical protein
MKNTESEKRAAVVGAEDVEKSMAQATNKPNSTQSKRSAA